MTRANRAGIVVIDVLKAFSVRIWHQSIGPCTLFCFFFPGYPATTRLTATMDNTDNDLRINTGVYYPRCVAHPNPVCSTESRQFGPNLARMNR